MKVRFKYHPVAAVFLAVLVLQAVVLKEAHHLLDQHHDAKAHCFNYGGEQHLHSEEYAFTSCQICLFHFAPADFSDVFYSVASILVFTSGKHFIYRNPFSASAKWTFHLRAPPTDAA